MSYSTSNRYGSGERPAVRVTGEYGTTVTLSSLLAFDGGVAIDLSPVTGHEVVPFELLADFVDAVRAYREPESLTAEHQRLTGALNDARDAFRKAEADYAEAWDAFHKAEADYQDARAYRDDADDVFLAAVAALKAFECLHNLN